jgi:dimethylglycine dehydrogenase
MRFDLKMFGMYAMDSMRLEKGFLAWKSEMNVHHTPLETNVAWTVKMDKDFIGKVRAWRSRRLTVFPGSWSVWCAPAEDADPWGYNPIFNGDRDRGHDFVGRLWTSHRQKHCIGLCADCRWLHREPDWKLKCWAKKLAAEVMAMPLYDPKNERMKA